MAQLTKPGPETKFIYLFIYLFSQVIIVITENTVA